MISFSYFFHLFLARLDLNEAFIMLTPTALPSGQSLVQEGAGQDLRPQRAGRRHEGAGGGDGEDEGACFQVSFILF